LRAGFARHLRGQGRAHSAPKCLNWYSRSCAPHKDMRHRRSGLWRKRRIREVGSATDRAHANSRWPCGQCRFARGLKTRQLAFWRTSDVQPPGDKDYLVWVVETGHPGDQAPQSPNQCRRQEASVNAGPCFVSDFGRRRETLGVVKIGQVVRWQGLSAQLDACHDCRGGTVSDVRDSGPYGVKRPRCRRLLTLARYDPGLSSQRLRANTSEGTQRVRSTFPDAR